MSLLLQIAERALNRPLMVHPDKLPLIMGVMEGRIPLGDIAALSKEAREHIAAMPSEAQLTMFGPNPTASRFVGSSHDRDTGQNLPYRRTSAGVAVIPVIGSLINRGAWLGSYSGETSYEGLKFQIDHAANDPRTHAILLDIDSPGGEAVGCFECAEAIRVAGTKKPVHAVVNGMAASAAYAIASAADRITVTKTGVVGSIGVVMLHADFSRKMDKEGITATLIYSGAHKVDGHPFAPLPEGVASDMQAECDQFYAIFVETVAIAGRATAKEIRATEARTYIGADAVVMKLADDEGTFETALADLSLAQIGQSTTKRRVSMAVDKSAPDANSGMTNAQVQEKVAAARAEGVEAGKAEATTSATAVRETAVAAATADAAKAERERIKAITGSDEAKGREAQALALALNTEMTAEQAKPVLAASPKAQLSGGRSADSPIGLATESNKPANAAEAYKPEEIAASINAANKLN